MELDDSSIEYDGRRRKRMRASAACTACRQVKTKCLSANRSQRCQRCIDLNLSCIYADSLRSKAGKGDSVRELKTTVGQLRQEMEELRRTATQPLQLPIQTFPAHSLPILDHTVSPGMHNINAGEYQQLFTESSSSSDTFLSRSDASPATNLNDRDLSSHNPLDMLYEASLRTFMDDNDKTISTKKDDKSKISPGRIDKQTSTSMPSTNSIGIQAEERATLQPARLNASEREANESELIKRGMVDRVKAQQLFEIYFQHCNQHIFALDPSFHTLERVLQRSHFLFTVVCYVASRYSDKEEVDSEAVCEVAMQMAREVMLTSDSVETIQGLLLLAAWSKRTKQSGDQIAWMLSGAAIRMAIGARLHEDPALKRGQERTTNSDTLPLETLNRQRTWLLCYAADRSISALTGNQPMMREEVVIRNCRSWCQQKDSRPWDAGISCYVELQKIQSRQFEQLHAMSSFEPPTSHSGLNVLVKMFNEQLNEWREEWTAILTTSVQRASASGVELDSLILDNIGRQLPLRLGHARLVLNSFALSQLSRKSQTRDEIAQLACDCYMAAKDVVYAVSLGSNMRYSPDTQFIMVAFACVTLLKLKQTSLAQSFAYLDAQEIRKVVSDTAESLNKLAMDREHSPALFASFLRRVLEMDAEGDSRAPSVAAKTSKVHQESRLQPLLSEATVDSDNLLWLAGSDQLLFNNAFYSAPSQACLGDEFWDSLLPNLSGPSIGTPSWLAKNKEGG